MSKIELNNKKQDDNVFPEGFLESLNLEDQAELVKLYQDFGILGVRKWIGDWNRRQVE